MRFTNNGITYVYGEDLSGVNLKSVDFSSTIFRHCSFIGAEIPLDFLDKASKIGGIRNCKVPANHLLNDYFLNAMGTYQIRYDLGAYESMYSGSPTTICMRSPCETDFIGYKTVMGMAPDKEEFALVTLLIPRQVNCIVYEGNKCRVETAKVLSICNSKGEPMRFGISTFNPLFIYVAGRTVKSDKFESDGLCECAPGIHFFLTKKEAWNYAKYGVAPQRMMYVWQYNRTQKGCGKL